MVARSEQSRLLRPRQPVGLSRFRTLQRACLRLAGVLCVTMPLVVVAAAATTASFAQRIAPLIEPAKLAKLGARGANPRVQKYVAQLAEAQQQHVPVSTVVAQAGALAGMRGEAAKLTADAIVRTQYDSAAAVDVIAFGHGRNFSACGSVASRRRTSARLARNTSPPFAPQARCRPSGLN